MNTMCCPMTRTCVRSCAGNMQGRYLLCFIHKRITPSKRWSQHNTDSLQGRSNMLLTLVRSRHAYIANAINRVPCLSSCRTQWPFCKFS
ncbi:hypothetical protein HBI16_031310 [Parastagonospora nodorum]|nr:hypothetical protein HBH52_150540 [Parastagonospora nodorum]KAH5100212.1 hypothetical protein HBH72_103810 [Parastagonospora nodorum]KAH5784207.1 hypothetical protein HBI16_031310 [Parastagonospora nodorum]